MSLPGPGRRLAATPGALVFPGAFRVERSVAVETTVRPAWRATGKVRGAQYKETSVTAEPREW